MQAASFIETMDCLPVSNRPMDPNGLMIDSRSGIAYVQVVVSPYMSGYSYLVTALRKNPGNRSMLSLYLHRVCPVMSFSFLENGR
jgi:hypothetical protein